MYSYVAPTRAEGEPTLIAYSAEVAEMVGLRAEECERPEFALVFAGGWVGGRVGGVGGGKRVDGEGGRGASAGVDLRDLTRCLPPPPPRPPHHERARRSRAAAPDAPLGQQLWGAPVWELGGPGDS